MITLDVEAVKAFILIIDLKSFTRAAEVLGTSQSVLSVKIKRLEDKIGQRLIERTSRQIRISHYGELFISSARNFITAHEQAISKLSSFQDKFKLGISCHAMGPEVQHIFFELRKLFPSIIFEINQDTPGVLLDNFSRNDLDIIILRAEDDRRYGTELCIENFGWYCSSDFKHYKDKPLQLASLSPHCGVRNLTIKALERTNTSWSEVFIADGIHPLISAISSGIAIGVLPIRTAPKELVEVGKKLGLPAIPPSSVVAHTHLSDKRSREILNTISTVFKEKSIKEPNVIVMPPKDNWDFK